MRFTQLFVVIGLIAVSRLHGQTWQWLNPMPQGDNISQITFINSQRGWIVVWSKSLLHTFDGGSMWQLLSTNISLRRISFITELEGWGVGSEHRSSLDAGIYHTTDGGRTWTHQLTDSIWGAFEDVKFTDAKHGWGLTSGSVWHTSDGGQTWNIQASRGFVRPAGGEYRLSFRDSLRGWMGGWQYYVSKTLDGGKAWERDSTLEGYNHFVFVDTLHGWASSTVQSWTRRNVARSTDGGLSWVETPSPLMGMAHPLSATACLAFADDGIYKTIDGGASWTLISRTTFNRAFIHNATNGWAHQDSGPNYFQTTDGGVSWIDRSEDAFGPGISFLWAADFVDTSYGWTVGSTFLEGTRIDEFVARTTDGGKTWVKTGTHLSSEPLAVSFVDRTTGWIAGRSGMIRKTTDGGFTWKVQQSGTTFTLWDVQFLDRLNGFSTGGSGPADPNVGAILKTNDGGETWLNITPLNTPRLGPLQFVDTLYGWVGGSSNFLRTTNGGVSWENPAPDSSIVGIDAFYFVDRMKGWGKGGAADFTQYHIMITDDGGTTWTIQFSDFLLDRPFGGEISFYDSLKGWVVGGQGAIWFTSDGGVTWENRTGFTTQFLRGIALAGTEKAWVVGTRGAILGLARDGVVSVVEENHPLLAEPIQLSPNFPNPFNALTTISYRLGVPGPVTLELYDILGRRVMRRELGYREIGEYTLQVNPQNLSSGIYFYSLITPHQRSPWGKMIFVR